MKALTVQQPWAWAIVHGGKGVENRTQAWSYRGPLAIHAGARESQRGVQSALVQRAMGDAMRAGRLPIDLAFGAFIGVVDLVDVHRSTGLGDDPWEWCCQPWGEPPGVLLKGDGKFTGPKTHLVLANPRPLATPIPATGRLGIWTPDDGVLEQLQDEVTSE